MPGQGSLPTSRAPPSTDDSGALPPIRHLQEAVSLGISQPVQDQDSPARQWKNRVMDKHKQPPDDSDTPKNVPPQPGDLDTLSEQQRKEDAFLQNYKAAPASRVHAPDDGNAMPPVNRPQRRGQQEQSLPAESGVNVVDIDKESRDVMVREGQSETRAAIMQGQSQIVTCRGCLGKLHAPVNCALVFCPTCNTVSRLDESAYS